MITWYFKKYFRAISPIIYQAIYQVIVLTALSTLLVFILPNILSDIMPDIMLGSRSYAAGSAENEIHVSSDELISDNQGGYAEFIGHVRASQGNTVIESDTLKILYVLPDSKSSSKPDSKSDQKPNLKSDQGKKNKPAAADAIKQIIARGHVVIRFNNIRAETNEAVYDTRKGILTLSGCNSRIIIEEKNSISGSRVIYYRDNGRIKVEKGAACEKQVEVVFPGKGELHFPGTDTGSNGASKN